jgi:hypothetical protein
VRNSIERLGDEERKRRGRDKMLIVCFTRIFPEGFPAALRWYCETQKLIPTIDTMKNLNILISLAAVTAFAAFPAFAHEGHEGQAGEEVSDSKLNATGRDFCHIWCD